MVRFVVFAFLLSHGLLAVTSESQSSQQPPDTTLRFDPETGLPSRKFSGRHQAPPTGREPGSGESTKQLFDGKSKTFQFQARLPPPIQFILGLPISIIAIEGVNLAISYDFSKGIEIRGNSDIYESFWLYPTLTLGFLVSPRSEFENLVYGIIEGHREWELENLWPSVFLGVGLGRYWGYLEDERSVGGTGLVLSAGAQARVGPLMGDLRLFRTPGLGEFVPVANVGYQPKSYLEILKIVGVGVGVAIAVYIWLILLIGGI